MTLAKTPKTKLESDSSDESEDVEEMESDQGEVDDSEDDGDSDDGKDEDGDNDEESDEDNSGQSTKRKMPKDSQVKIPLKKAKMSQNEELREDNTIHISNISSRVTKEEFQKIFPKASSIRFPTKYDGSSKGFAFLVFEKEKTMNKCLAENQGLELKGKELKLVVAGDKKTMYVKGINRSVKENDLQKIFPEATSINYPLTNNGKPKGYAFVQFGSESEVKKIVSQRQGLVLKGEKLFLDYVSNRKKEPQSFRAHGDIKRDGYLASDEPEKILTIRNLSYSLTENALKEKFNCLFVHMIKDPETGQSKGRAYLTFKNKRNAKEVMKFNNEKKLDGRIVYIYYAKKTGKLKGLADNMESAERKETNQGTDEDEEEEF